MPMTQLTRHILAGLYKNSEGNEIYRGLGEIEVSLIEPITIDHIRKEFESFERFALFYSSVTFYWVLCTVEGSNLSSFCFVRLASTASTINVPPEII